MFKKALWSFLVVSLLFQSFNSFVFASNIQNVEDDIDSLEQYLTLKNSESHKILQGVPDKLMNNWQDMVMSANLTEDINALLIVKLFANTNIVKFLTVDFPLELSYDIGKEMISMARLLGAGDVSGLIGKIEKISVEKAVEYATDEVFKHEVKIGSGAIVMNYTAKDGQKAEAQVNYLISKEYINDKKSGIVVKFYSPKKMKLPENPGSAGGFAAVFESDKEIKPFVVTLKGEMEYKYFNYSWVSNPEINVVYPEKVPDFGFKPISFWEEKVVRPVKESFKQIDKIWKFLGGSVFDAFGAKNLETIENNEELKKVAEDIKDIEEDINEEIEEMQEEQSEQDKKNFEEEVARLNDENQTFKTKENNSIILKDNMTEEEMRNVLIALYKELLKRKDTLSDVKLAIQEKKDKDEQKEKKDEDNDYKKEKEEKKDEDNQKIKKSKEIAYCVYQKQIPLQNNLIINEIAWMGTASNSADEWIELKNIGSETIDLNGYQLLDKDNQIKVVFEDVQIEPNHYVLLERTDDNTVPNVLADVIYKGNLNNDNEALYLFNNNCELEDIVIANPNWEAGNKDTRKSMERKADLTWQTYFGDSFGTPFAQNSEGQTTIYLPGGGGGGGTDPESPEEEPNPTYCLQTGLADPARSPVIINEIAWMGTQESSNDEWIELKNIGSEEVSLLNWQLLDKDNQIKVIFNESDMIPAGGFYLLERTDDDTVPSVAANKIYTGALSDTDETLRLFNNNCELIDEVIANPDWGAGDKDAKKSMERKADLTWQAYYGDSFGTPYAQNSEEPEDDVEVPNPASVYCVENGGELIIKTKTDGEYGVCVFEDNKECEEWALYEGKCPLVGIDVSWYTTDEQTYCVIKGGWINEDGDSCTLENGKTCSLIDYYDGSCSDNTYATSLVITDVDDGYGNDDREYVRIFNQSGSDINLCTDENCTYLAYFSRSQEDGALPKWNEPNLNIALPKVNLQNNSYFQIDLSKDNRGDFKPLEDDDYFYPNNASICLFNQDVTLLSEEDAQTSKIDCLGWLFTGWEDYPNYIKEGTEVYRYADRTIDQREYVISRKKDSSNNLYFDRDNNTIDFEHIKPPIYTLPPVLNLNYTELDDKTKLKLSWDYAESLDPSKLSYKIYYTINSDFDENNLIEIIPESINVLERHFEVVISKIEEGVDYRFKIKLLEDNGNESDLKEQNPLLYLYSSSFDNHLSRSFGYDANKTNNVNYIGPKNSIVSLKYITEDNGTRPPVIDKYGNLYSLQLLNILNYNQRIVSYDKNGLFRWSYDRFSNTDAILVIKDGIYYFSRDTMIKFSPTGDKLWETYISDAIGSYKAMFYNDYLYFECLVSEKRGICKRSFDENAELELIYEINSTKEISNLIVDEASGTIFFIIEDAKLIKLEQDGSISELELEIDEYSVLSILGNKVLVSSYEDLFLVDKDNLNIIFESRQRELKIDYFAVDTNGFYLFENYGGGFENNLSFLDINKNTIEELGTVKRTNHPPIVDGNGNLYYISLDGYIMGYEIIDGSASQILEHVLKGYGSMGAVLISNKIYHMDGGKLAELSFE